MEACSTQPGAYTSTQNCMDICAAFPLGDADNSTAITDASIGCRVYHSNVALNQTDNSSIALHCWHAGPSGGNQCGTPCQAYCAMMNYSCSAQYPFLNDAFCLSSCALYDPSGNVNTTSGANLWCKIYHVIASFGVDKSHCTHAAPSGSNVCGTVCENYCILSTKACFGGNTLYGDMNSCMAFCNGIPNNGTITDRAGDTKDCRVYHALFANATGNTTTHCPHASHSGGNVCGAWCDVYCDLASSACNGINQLYSSNSLCQTACQGISTNGRPGDTVGDSIQCRIYQLGIASQSASLALTNCGYAAVNSRNGVCGSLAPTSKITETGNNAYTIILSTLMFVGALLF